MAKNLVIVESPAKAKTIEKFLGADYLVKSCIGHIRDLKKGNFAVDTQNDYKPTYEIVEGKEQIIKELKKLAKEAETVWLATDEDREGEAIAWHLIEALGLESDKTKRVVYNEITKSAILKAIENPRGIDNNLVDAQQARRILDRLVGFELSPILWKKVRGKLSAGRVQSVAVRLIVEREREIGAFQSESAFKVTAIFRVGLDSGEHKSFKAELPARFSSEKEAENFLNKCIGAEFTINDLQVKPAKKSPSAPFITSTLQQEASRKLSFSVSRTMMVAQKLYEAGKITYMRTDSVNIAESAKKETADTISSLYGKEFVQTRQYKAKAGAQEAHEAIRPTILANQTTEGTADEERLYDLIWKRTIASQMSDAQLEKTTASIGISTAEEELIATGEVIKFEGFLKVYMESTDEGSNGYSDKSEEEGNLLLPPLKVGQLLDLEKMEAVERFSRPAARYTEASLVKKLEEMGIGRPSTYAPTISTVQKRGYVVKEDREGALRKYKVFSLINDQITKTQKEEITGAERAKLFPTDIGKLVNDFLLEHFDKVMDYNFTAQIEEEFDEIARGKKQWNKMIDNFYKPFHSKVEKTLETAERVSGERELGTDSKTGLPVIVRMGKYGPLAQLGKRDDEKKPKYAGLLPDQQLETITLEEALMLFILPRILGEYENQEVKANIGRYGPYVQHGKIFVSIKDNYDPYTITLEEAIKIIEEKRKEAAERTIQIFEGNDIQVLKGRYGPYIKTGDRNVRIPKDKDPKQLTLEECQQIIETTPVSKKRGGFRKK